MKKLPISLLGLLALATASQAQTTVSSDPVGFNSITALGNSDTRFSVPLHRTQAYQGAVASVSGNVITLSGTPGFTASQFVYASGTQTDTFYVEFATGAKSGLSYTVASNDASSVTLNLNGDTLSSVAAGDTLRIIPYWTLNTLFPSQAGISTTSAINGTGSLTQILMPDLTNPGVDLTSPATYYYYSGTSFGGPGWRKLAGGFTNIKNDDVIPPDVAVVVRQNGVATSSLLTATGAVPTNGRKYVIGTLASNTPQDNAIAIDVPVTLSLTQSNLFESGAFAGTTAINGTSGDQLLVFDDTVAGFDKNPTATYYYYTGTSFGGAGWRKLAGGFTNIKNTDTPFQPGSGFIIRKQATSNATAAVWSLPLPY
jgi:uncharacterized protein (TIGR02597 family)